MRMKITFTFPLVGCRYFTTFINTRIHSFIHSNEPTTTTYRERETTLWFLSLFCFILKREEKCALSLSLSLILCGDRKRRSRRVQGCVVVVVVAAALLAVGFNAHF
jgi:hypothetical protein